MNGLRISELARSVGIPTSTVRYYERIGLIPGPARSDSGYRIYDADAQTRLLFITRAKRLGLSLEAIAELAVVWDGTNCGATQARLTALLDTKRAEIAEQIRELESFGVQLALVQQRLAANEVLDECGPDLSCCTPDLAEVSIPLDRTPAVSALGAAEPRVAACTLTLGERPDRVAEFVGLSQYLASWSREVTTLRLRFDADPEAARRLRTLATNEQTCCRFLTFDIDERDNQLLWTIRAPDVETGPALDEFLPLLIPELETSSR